MLYISLYIYMYKYTHTHTCIYIYTYIYIYMDQYPPDSSNVAGKCRNSRRGRSSINGAFSSHV